MGTAAELEDSEAAANRYGIDIELWTHNNLCCSLDLIGYFFIRNTFSDPCNSNVIYDQQLMTQFANNTIQSSFFSVLFFQVLFTIVNLVIVFKKNMNFQYKKPRRPVLLVSYLR